MPPEGTITRYAQEHDVDLIVVGTKGASGFAKQLLGSVALGVVTYAHCTVINKEDGKKKNSAVE